MKKKKISQDILRQYYLLAFKERQIAVKRKALREKLINRLKSASVESGRYCPLVVESEARAFTKDAVINALGEDQYSWLQSQVAPKPRLTFRVIDKKK